MAVFISKDMYEQIALEAIFNNGCVILEVLGCSPISIVIDNKHAENMLEEVRGTRWTSIEKIVESLTVTETVSDVFHKMSDEQKNIVYSIVGQGLESINHGIDLQSVLTSTYSLAMRRLTLAGCNQIQLSVSEHIIRVSILSHSKGE